MDQKTVLNTFRYEDGNLFYKNNVSAKQKAQAKAGYIDKKKGYVRVYFDNKLFYLHRIIFLMHYGYCPEIIDHIDRNGLNNKIENLRPASRAQNQFNSKQMVNNTSGHKNVFWCKRANRWIVKFNINNKQIQCGMFKCINEAIDHAKICRNKYHKDFAVC